MTPWQLAGTSEHSHQRALFAWANCAARYGFDVANDLRGYTTADRLLLQHDMDAQSWEASKSCLELAMMFAIPNGGKRSGATGSIMKAEGVKPGVPDIMLPVTAHRRVEIEPGRMSGGKFTYCGLFIEMKKPSAKPKRSGAGGVRDTQSAYHNFLRNQGYRVVTCYSWIEARDAIIEYLT